MKKSAFFLALLAIFTACEHGGDYFYDVKNASSHVLKLTVEKEKGGPETTNIAPGTTLTFAEINTVNSGSSDFKNGFLRWFDTLKIAPLDTSLGLAKDFKKREEWQFSPGKRRYAPNSRYSLTIEDQDIR